jgi:CDP-diacylglycerol--glycerol-3-phosphate 3-phosphatidyltransferase
MYTLQADKLMISTSLILLAGRYGAPVAVPAAVILARELAVSALREWMAGQGLRDVVQVGYQGKVKTALTMASLTLLLLVPATGGGLLSKLQGPSLVLLYLCAIITVTSGSVYFRAAAPILRAKAKAQEE